MMITRKRIDLSHHVAGLQHTGAGAWALFAGNVRDNHRGRAVAYLHYEAMLPLAERMIREIVEAAVSEFGLLHGKCLHRIGRVEVGETAVLVLTAAAHREAAYAANRRIIDTVKREVPIWKKEYWTAGGFDWGAPCCGALPPGEGAR